MNIDRIRERLDRAEMRGGGTTPVCLIKDWQTGRPDPLPNDGGLYAEYFGEPTEAILERHGITFNRRKPPPMIRLTLN